MSSSILGCRNLLQASENDKKTLIDQRMCFAPAVNNIQNSHLGIIPLCLMFVAYMARMAQCSWLMAKGAQFELGAQGRAGSRPTLGGAAPSARLGLALCPKSSIR